MCVLRCHQNAAAEAHCFSKLLDVFPLRKLKVALDDDVKKNNQKQNNPPEITFQILKDIWLLSLS